MYDAESHWHMFYLPKNIREAIDEPGPILDEEHPIYLTRKEISYLISETRQYVHAHDK